uniref:hypothetical protein n=1 Tax=Flavobacterium sp. TaxID=239 RepID=UPI00404B5396
MKYFFSFTVVFFIILGCSNNQKQNELSAREAQKNTAIFLEISKKWNFIFPKTETSIQATLNSWNEWTQFQKELEQKPKTTLLAFQLKISNVSQKADSLGYTIPEQFNIPQVRSRLVTLNTKINALDTYMNLQKIPEKKVVQLIENINSEIKGIYGQYNEILIKKMIPKEIGEDDMIKALDTSRMATAKFLDENIERSNKVIDKPKQ